MGWYVRAGVLDRAGWADPDRIDAGGDGCGDVRFRARLRPSAVVVRGCRARRRRPGGAAMAGRGGGGRLVVVVAGRRCESVRSTRRTRPRHVGQPLQPGRHLERRRCTSLAHNAFRGHRGCGAAGCRRAGTSCASTPARRGAAADPRGGGGGGARGDGLRARNGVRRGDDPDTAWTRRCARRTEVGRPGRARLFAGRCGGRCHAASPASDRGDRADLLCGTDRDVARSGLGSRRQDVGRAVPAGMGSCRGDRQRRPAARCGAPRRQHAPLHLGR